MDQLVPDDLSISTVRRINREAGYVVLSTLGVFLTGMAVAIPLGHFFGSTLCHIFLAIVFSFAVFPIAFMAGGHGYVFQILAYAASVAFASPFIIAGIILGWRSSVWYGRPSAFMLAIKVAIFSSSLVVGVTMVIGLVTLLLKLYTGTITGVRGDTLLTGLMAVPFVCVSGVLLAAPSALICANGYLRILRPILLKRGYVVSLDLIDALAAQRRNAAIQDVAATP
jgi:hypothetical protein